MTGQDILHSFFLIFSGAAVIATAALYTRQPMLVAYIVLGALAGPHGVALVNDTALLAGIAEIGIIFLLFWWVWICLLETRNMLGGLLTALGTTAVFFPLGAGHAELWLFDDEAVIVGIGVTFSSTILGVSFYPQQSYITVTWEKLSSVFCWCRIFLPLLLILIGYLGGSAAQNGVALLTLALGLPALIAGALMTVKWRFAVAKALRRLP